MSSQERTQATGMGPLHASGRFNVLITSAGRRVQLVAVFRHLLNELGGGSVVAVDFSRLAPATHVADRQFQVPRITSDQYLRTILELCADNQVALVVPTIDTELSLLAGAREDFRDRGIEVAVSDGETIAISADKQRTHEWLRRHGFPTPRRLERDVDGSITIPAQCAVVVKPVDGSRSIGIRFLPAFPEARVETIPDTAVVEEFVEGVEYTVSGYVDRNGHCVSAVPRERLEVRDGEVSKAVTRRIPLLEQLVREVLEELPGAWGPLNVQAIQDAHTGDFKIIEINARFGGGDPLAWAAGAQAPKWLIDEILGRPMQASKWLDGLTMLRYDSAVYLNEQGAQVETP